MPNTAFYLNLTMARKSTWDYLAWLERDTRLDRSTLLREILRYLVRHKHRIPPLRYRGELVTDIRPRGWPVKQRGFWWPAGEQPAFAEWVELNGFGSKTQAVNSAVAWAHTQGISFAQDGTITFGAYQLQLQPSD